MRSNIKIGLKIEMFRGRKKFIRSSRSEVTRREIGRNWKERRRKKWLTAHKIIHAYQEHNLVKGR